MNYPTKTKINQLIIDHPETERSTVRAFTSKPAPSIEKQYGRLFGLIEIKASDVIISAFVDFIIDQLKANYYKPGDDSIESVEERFEKALQKTNINVATFLETESVMLNLEDVNIIIGVIAGRELVFSAVGTMSIFLIKTSLKHEQKIIDILDSTKSSGSTPSPLKLFSQVLNGQIRPSDVVLVTTENVLDYFSLDKIKTTIGSASANRRNGLKELFSTVTSNENFGLIAAELQKTDQAINEPEDLKKFDYREAAKKDSIRQLIQTESNTQKLLTPTLMPEIKKYSKIFSQAFSNYVSKIKDNSLSQASEFKKNIKSPKFKLPAIKKPNKLNLPNFRINKKIKTSLKSAKKFTRPIAKTTRAGFDYIAKKSFWKKFTNLINKVFSGIQKKFKRLPRSSKVLLITSILLAIFLIQSIIVVGIKNAREAKIEQFTQAIVDIENKKNESEASLIYRDESQARAFLVEAQNQLNQLSPTNKAQEDQVLLLNSEIEIQLQELRHMITIDEPLQIVNFANLDNQATLSNVLLLVDNNTVYAQNKTNQSLYKANLDSRAISAIFTPTVDSGSLTHGTVISNQELLFFNESKNAFSFNPTTEALDSKIINLSGSVNVKGIAGFNNRLYLLDSANNQISRFNKTNSGYGNATNWTNDDRIDIRDGVDLVVDGAIFVLKSNGKVLRLEQGKLTTFENPVIDPPLKNPTQLYTTIESDFVYILDPETKRVVVITKDGQLARQYFSESFNDLKDFIVRESEKRIYVLDGTSILGIPVEHL